MHYMFPKRVVSGELENRQTFVGILAFLLLAYFKDNLVPLLLVVCEYLNRCESPHSLGTTTQLSRARSTTKLIPRLFPFYIPIIAFNCLIFFNIDQLQIYLAYLSHLNIFQILNLSLYFNHFFLI